MSGNHTLDRFLEFFNSNAGGVISTITNTQLIFKTKSFETFHLDKIQKNVSLPCVLTTINFTGKAEFQIQVITACSTVASLADLMMLGTGDAAYNPDEHNDSIKEMLNQVLGSLQSELANEDISIGGTVSEVTSTDLEVHKEFLTNDSSIELSFDLLGKETYFYLILDQEAISAIENIFTVTPDDILSNDSTPPAKNKPTMASSSNDPITVSRASFSEIEEVRPINAKNINIDNLLDINLPVTVELGNKDMRIKEILELGQGSVVELSKLAGDLVDLKINGKKFAVGEVMVVDENYAVRIVNLISREERIRSLGPE
jgi:flagellar motor switch protein FliN/FliY